MIKRNMTFVFLSSLIIATPAFAQQPPGDTGRQPSGTPNPPQETPKPGTQHDTPRPTMKPGSQETTQGAPGQEGQPEHARGHKTMGAMIDSDLTDAQLAAMIHQINQHEIEMASMANDRAESQRVKSFAKQLQADHEKADKALMTLAAKKGWDLTAALPAEGMDEKQGYEEHAAEMKSQMTAMTGADFDRHFLIMMQKGHADAILLLTAQGYAQPIDKDLKAEIKRQIPAIERHRTRSISLLEQEGKAVVASG